MSVDLTTVEYHPWTGGWGDLYYEKNNNVSGVITYFTIGQIFADMYRTDKEREWGLKWLKLGPGVYKDSEVRSTSSNHCYTIILDAGTPSPALTKELFKEKVEELNKEYGENFEVDVPEQAEELIPEEE